MYDKDYFKKREAYSKRDVLMARTLRAIGAHHPKTVLDVGCGMGYLVKYLNEQGYNTWGVDSAPVLTDIRISDKVIVTSCEHIPFEDKHFDLVVSSDFLEHIAEEDVDKYVDEMCRVGKVVLARISFKPDGEYHLTVKPKDWWLKKLGDRVTIIT